MQKRLPHDKHLLHRIYVKEHKRFRNLFNRLCRLAKQADKSRRLMDKLLQRLTDCDPQDTVWIGPEGSDPDDKTPPPPNGMSV